MVSTVDLAGQLTRLTDPLNGTVNFGYETARRVQTAVKAHAPEAWRLAIQGLEVSLHLRQGRRCGRVLAGLHHAQQVLLHLRLVARTVTPVARSRSGAIVDPASGTCSRLSSSRTRHEDDDGSSDQASDR